VVKESLELGCNYCTRQLTVHIQIPVTDHNARNPGLLIVEVAVAVAARHVSLDWLPMATTRSPTRMVPGTAGEAISRHGFAKQIGARRDPRLIQSPSRTRSTGNTR
jgi:hypothetical protein